jgi:hypothetical protein
MSNITFGSHVTTCDCLVTGRVNMVWPAPPGAPPVHPSPWPCYQVFFPPRLAPFDAAVYRAYEVALYNDRPPLVNLDVVALMMPRITTRQP